jgi:hypothetical protein
MQLTGSILLSTYGNNIASEVAIQSPAGVRKCLLWLHQSWVGMSNEWLGGVMPVALPASVGLWFGWRYVKRCGLFVSCSLGLFALYGLFVMISRTWFGPRWYAPLLPVVAFLVACGIVAALDHCKEKGTFAIQSKMYVCSILAAISICWLLAVPVRLFELREQPPHGTDVRVVESVREAGLSNAVVALENLIGNDGEWHYKSFRSGLWSMQVPFEKNDVIYVVALPEWERKVKEMWPTRDAYRISTVKGDFSLDPVK